MTLFFTKILMSGIDDYIVNTHGKKSSEATEKVPYMLMICGIEGLIIVRPQSPNKPNLCKGVVSFCTSHLVWSGCRCPLWECTAAVRTTSVPQQHPGDLLPTTSGPPPCTQLYTQPKHCHAARQRTRTRLLRHQNGTLQQGTQCYCSEKTWPSRPWNCPGSIRKRWRWSPSSNGHTLLPSTTATGQHPIQPTECATGSWGGPNILFQCEVYWGGSSRHQWLI